MKLSTRIYKEVPEATLCVSSKIVFLLGWYAGKTERIEVSLAGGPNKRNAAMNAADRIHNGLLNEGYTLLPKESPVCNSLGEIILHYTATTYWYWRNELTEIPKAFLYYRLNGSEVPAVSVLMGRDVAYNIYSDEPGKLVRFGHCGMTEISIDEFDAKTRNIYKILHDKLTDTVSLWKKSGII